MTITTPRAPIEDWLTVQQFADRIVGLRAGEIVFDGKPSKLDASYPLQPKIQT